MIVCAAMDDFACVRVGQSNDRIVRRHRPFIGWGEVIRQLAQRSDQIEGELRAFIKKEERPETGFQAARVSEKAPEAATR
jgi:hypothetical protein